jgi:hypothetical protein
MSKKTKWVILWLQNCWQRQRNEIFIKEFDTELDMLVWASKNAIPKGYNLHHTVTPDGVNKLPNDLYERIDALRQELIEKEQKAAEKERLVTEDTKPRKRPHKNRETLYAEKQAREQCITQ